MIDKCQRVKFGRAKIQSHVYRNVSGHSFLDLKFGGSVNFSGTLFGHQYNERAILNKRWGPFLVN